MTTRQDAGQEPAFRLQAAPGSVLVLRLVVTSRNPAPAMLQPHLDPWVGVHGAIVSGQTRVAPAYVYLAPGQEARLTLTNALPADLAVGEVLQSGLGFPGAEPEVLPLSLEIVEPGVAPREHNLGVRLPLGSDDPTAPEVPTSSTQAIYRLVACMAGLEVVPSKWLAGELLIAVCECGLDYSETEEGAALLQELSRTRLVKNGVLAFRGAHIPTWAMVGTSLSSGLRAAFGGSDGNGRMLSAWEGWLLDLIDLDIESEASEASGAKVAVPNMDHSFERLGATGDKWFGYLLLGLSRISRRLDTVLRAVARTAPKAPPDPVERPPEPNDVLAEKGSLQR